MIEDYFEFLKKVANKHPSVKEFRLIKKTFHKSFIKNCPLGGVCFYTFLYVKEFVGVKKSFIRFVIRLRDDSELHVFEYVDSSLHKIDYSYHWQDKEKRLITRWDNAPHHSEIETFPHHVHDGGDIKPSEEPTFVEILKKIGEGI